jgi:hypothetical protein
MRAPFRAAVRGAAAALLLASALAAAGQGADPDEAIRRRIVETAESLVGVPYVYGAESPQAFDCSGFTRYVFRKASGIELPRSARDQYGVGEGVGLGLAKPGDLLVYDTVGGAPSHVAIFLGDGRMIHAASQGTRTGVIVSKLEESYFPPRFLGVRRILGVQGPATVAAAKPPAAASTAAKPAIAKAEKERVVEPIGFALSAKPSVYDDPIPAAIGASLAFVVRNETGADGVFVFAFYRVDPATKKYLPIREDRRPLKAGASVEIPPVTFDKAGIYRLNVKTAGNTQLMQRTWKVVEQRPAG